MKDPDYMKLSIGRQIRLYRQKAGFSREDLAQITGKSIAGIANIERGRCFPKMSVFIDISNILKVSADQLLCDGIEKSKIAGESEWTEMLESLSPEKRQLVYQVIEALKAASEESGE